MFSFGSRMYLQQGGAVSASGGVLLSCSRLPQSSLGETVETTILPENKINTYNLTNRLLQLLDLVNLSACITAHVD